MFSVTSHHRKAHHGYPEVWTLSGLLEVYDLEMGRDNFFLSKYTKWLPRKKTFTYFLYSESPLVSLTPQSDEKEGQTNALL